MSVVAVLEIISGGVELATEILGKSSNKQNKEILKEYVSAEIEALEAERAVELEKEKPMEDQFDNVVEHFEKKQKHFEKKAKILMDAAKQEYLRLNKDKK